jgi:hypothetical protein
MAVVHEFRKALAVTLDVAKDLDGADVTDFVRYLVDAESARRTPEDVDLGGFLAAALRFLAALGATRGVDGNIELLPYDVPLTEVLRRP